MPNHPIKQKIYILYNIYAQRNHYPTSSFSHFGKGNGGKPRRAQETTSHAEDYQPNECINKRKQAAPPVISTASQGGRSSSRDAGLRGGHRASFTRRHSGAGGYSLKANSDSSLHAVAPWNPVRIYTPPASYSSPTNDDDPPSDFRNNTEAVEIHAPIVTLEPQNKRQKLAHEETVGVAVSSPCSHPSI